MDAWTALPIGILALQGNVDQHAAVLEELAVPVRRIRRLAELEGISGLILPGGESTTVNHFFDLYGWWEPLAARIQGGLPVFGTCMGAILLAAEVLPGPQRSLGVLDATLARNAYGPQTESFAAQISSAAFGGGAPLAAHFIRAPRFTRCGPAVEILASVGTEPVIVRQGHVLASTFHPEVAGEVRLHRWFAENCCRKPVLPEMNRNQG